MANITQERLFQIAKTLNITIDEAIELVKSDEEIDKGAKHFELTPEQKKVAKKMTCVDKKPHTKPNAPREKKVNKDKQEIMQTIDDALCCLVDNVDELNNDRELTFVYNNVKYKLTLSCPRK